MTASDLQQVSQKAQERGFGRAWNKLQKVAKTGARSSWIRASSKTVKDLRAAGFSVFRFFCVSWVRW